MGESHGTAAITIVGMGMAIIRQRGQFGEGIQGIEVGVEWAKMPKRGLLRAVE